MFVHLHTHSPFSFLDGVADIEHMVAQAALQGMPALALTDHNTIAGLPSFHRWAAVYGIKPISGAEITLADDTHLTLLAETKKGYENLCRILTEAHGREGGRLSPRVDESFLFAHSEGLIVLSGCRKGRIPRAIRQREYTLAKDIARRYQQTFGNSFYLEIHADALPDTRRLNQSLTELADELQIPLAATGNVHYVTQNQFPVHDVLRCISLDCDIHSPHANRPLNDGQWLFPVEEAKRRFAFAPQSALFNTLQIAERCEVVLSLTESLFPAYTLPEGVQSSQGFLRELVYKGAGERYSKVDDKLRERLEHELSIIEELGYTDYFLVVWDIVHYARRHHIRCAGRGSAADSAVAYCLYITDVDAAGRGLLFERFMSLERAEKPDIDIDFDSRRRDEVMDYVYRKYGRQHVARVATYQTFRGRSAIREVGGALGLPRDILDKLAKRVPFMAHADQLEALFTRVPELQSLAHYRDELKWLWQLAAEIAGFPRHFGMHVGGVVISRRPLLETTSLQPSAQGDWITPFDKEGVEEVGLVKLDLLSLRTMSAISDTIVLRERQGRPIDYDNIPLDDARTFDRLGRGETIGVFQLESPAQRTLQTRLKPDGLEDIVASVALIRPGPIQGNMVDPFLARRGGREPISYLHPKLEPILGKTYGVVLFQEQVIEIATAIANFTPGEADGLRRVMSKARSHAEMEKIGRHFLDKAMAQGIEESVAQTIFSYIQSYASYGFCEAHAAAFATTAYKTAYLVEYYPAEFFASILNQYPMGYYPVHVICAEARRRGIRLLPVDVNESEWGCTVPDDKTIRLGFCLLKGMRQSLAQDLQATRTHEGRFTSVPNLLHRVPAMDRRTAERCIRCGALDALIQTRRLALWQLPDFVADRHADYRLLDQDVSGQAGTPGTGKTGAGTGKTGAGEAKVADILRTDEAIANELPLAAKLADEYNLLGVGLSGHWVSLFREKLQLANYVNTTDVEQLPDEAVVWTAGVVVRPHRPPTPSGKTVVFFSLEDEFGFVDATMFQDVYQQTGAVIFTPYGRLIGVMGTVQRRDGGRPQLLVSRVWSLIDPRRED
jgi:error-prone DNA polymerase